MRRSLLQKVAGFKKLLASKSCWLQKVAGFKRWLAQNDA
jgi:hypothetical protein